MKGINNRKKLAGPRAVLEGINLLLIAFWCVSVTGSTLQLVVPLISIDRTGSSPKFAIVVICFRQLKGHNSCN